MSAGLRAGQVAEAVGVNVETLRYYERRGIIEEPQRSPYLGFGYSRDLAGGATTIAGNVNFVFDLFDPLTWTGVDLGWTRRYTLNGNLGITQALSPTTLGSLSYGLTAQLGTLETTWHSTEIIGSGERRAERMPDHRIDYVRLNMTARRGDR